MSALCCVPGKARPQEAPGPACRLRADLTLFEARWTCTRLESPKTCSAVSLAMQNVQLGASVERGRLLSSLVFGGIFIQLANESNLAQLL